EEGIDADIRRVDNLTVATNPAQLERVREECETTRSWDADPERIGLLDAEATRARINIRNVMGGFVIRGQARVQPAKLVRGLAAAVERLGVSIYEKTTVTVIAKGIVATDRGTVRAETIIRATEGFTAGIPGEERTWLALNSAQIVTEPLSEELWRKIGWEGHELLGNAAHAYCYAQRTRDGRITMGGRGVPYRYGSRTDINGQTQQATIDQLHTILTTLLPQTAGCRIDHAWCGVLGVPRDWCTTVGLDPATRIGWAGGYVGLGVSSSNLSGRTLTDLVLGQDTELTRLPWVNRRVRPWEPEPFRWLGVHSMYQLYRIADQREAAGLAHTSKLAAVADAITGH
ncbi:MAG: FAD-dependent oxidoreductase, partial [Mesorhizobium sp.]